jgi:UDP-glucuronate 4-epimerase
MGQKIVVTGGAGFIGAAIADRLCQNGDVVLAIDNLNDYYDPKLKQARLKYLSRHSDFSFVRADIADAKALNGLVESFQPDAIVHLAAQAGVRYSMENPKAYGESNLVGFLNILECARTFATKHLVYASSSSVYGANTVMPYSIHHGADHPMSLYAATKKANEMMAHSYSHLYKIPTTGLRFFTVYGPWGRPDMAVYSFTKKILKGEVISLFNQGLHKRDYTYIEDICDALTAVLLKPPKTKESAPNGSISPATSAAPYRLYNIGNSEPIPLMELVSALEEITGRQAKTELMNMQPGDVADTCADMSDLEREFNFSPKTSFKTGLREFYNWYQDYHQL